MYLIKFFYYCLKLNEAPCQIKYIMNEAWTLAIEALSWVELRRVNEDSALSRAIIQFGVKDSEIVDEAKRLVFEVLKATKLFGLYN
jgi:hypothetical protein